MSDENDRGEVGLTEELEHHRGHLKFTPRATGKPIVNYPFLSGTLGLIDRTPSLTTPRDHRI